MAGILIVGCGDLGQAIGMQLVAQGHKVVGVRRQLSEASNFQMISADVTQPETLKELADISPSILIYCVSAGAQSDEAYFAHYVSGLKNILAVLKLSKKPLQHLIFVSSTRVYGQTTERLIDDETLPEPNDFGGHRLMEAEQVAASSGVGYTLMRLSGIYGPGRLRMIRLAKNPETWSAQNSWSNRIHRDDAAAFIVFTVNRILSGHAVANCYLVTDSTPVSQQEVLLWLADQLGIKVKITNDTNQVTGGKRLSNARMLTTGFNLQYPDYRSGYLSLLKSLV